MTLRELIGQLSINGQLFDDTVISFKVVIRVGDAETDTAKALTIMGGEVDHVNTILQRYLNLVKLGKWEAYHDYICAESARDSCCNSCGHAGLGYQGFRMERQRVAIAVCPNCGDQWEF
jgi:hypothetical protein